MVIVFIRQSQKIKISVSFIAQNFKACFVISFAERNGVIERGKEKSWNSTWGDKSNLRLPIDDMNIIWLCVCKV